MATNTVSIRSMLSEIDNDLKSTIDTRLSPRFIYTKLINNLANLLKQVNESKRLYKSSDLKQRIKCLQMETVSATTCDELAPLVKGFVAKSVERIPITYTGSFGDIVFDLTSINPYGKTYRIVTSKEFSKIRKREFQDPTQGYAFIIHNYLYIPDSEIETVTITAAFKNPMEVAILNGDDNCRPFLDYEFYCPEYLRKIVHDLTLSDLAGVNQRTVKDEDANQNESDRGTQPKKLYN